ncbi:unnamed protein product [Rangifer tarandus platyrhynchus]|uniref:Uncharacterized protein n=1 Tax=Rangifer tarandus platyrhynchus TaxID=3082113 RepID=A0ABN8YMV3_RANTA|nr:unnamed protein product [Rangifer tarandus platyrhynchus]
MKAKGLEGLTARIGRLGPGSPRLSLFGEIERSAPSSEDLLTNSLPGAPSCAIAAWSHLQATPSLSLDRGPLHGHQCSARIPPLGAGPPPRTPRERWPITSGVLWEASFHFPAADPAVPANPRARPQATSHRLWGLPCAGSVSFARSRVSRVLRVLRRAVQSGSSEKTLAGNLDLCG